MTIPDKFHNDLKLAIALIYIPCGLQLTNPVVNTESIVYGACTFELNGKTILHRASKTTPTKTGQFVTIWKRNKEGITEPFHISDPIDFIIITSRSGANFGQFIFPKSVLATQGIVSQNGKEGKRGFRVYPPWDKVTSKQARQAQSWQIKYFLSMHNERVLEHNWIKNLFAN